MSGEAHDTYSSRNVEKPLRGRTVGAIMALAVGVVWFLALTGKPTMPGTQVVGIPEIRMAQPVVMQWQELESSAREGRPGFPEPMVSRTDRICIGFGRVDFTQEDRRPSVARCVDPPAVGSAGPGAIATLMTVASGLDTWHFLVAANPVGDVRVVLSDDEALGRDRIYVNGPTFALRLPNGRELDQIEWSSGSRNWRCEPEAEVWQTSVFCPSTSSPG